LGTAVGSAFEDEDSDPEEEVDGDEDVLAEEDEVEGEDSTAGYSGEAGSKLCSGGGGVVSSTTTSSGSLNACSTEGAFSSFGEGSSLPWASEGPGLEVDSSGALDSSAGA